MLTYLHDIRNKLTLISYQATKLSKKHGEDDFISIRTNLVRINELLNDAYRHMRQQQHEKKIRYSPAEFVRQMDLLTETMQLLYPVQFQNDVCGYKTQENFNIEFNIGLVFRVIENAIDNSVNANSSKIIVRIIETAEFCVYEITDNGTGKIDNESDCPGEIISIVPHGIGKEIMTQNMNSIGGQIKWTGRIDHSGMIVSLFFPKILQHDI
jgi:K+-sensing histidine kinase KdpD